MLLAIVVFLFVTGLIVGGCIAAAVLIDQFYRQQVAWVRQEQGGALASIADIKSAAIVAWRRERLGDAQVLSTDTTFGLLFWD